MNGIQIAANFVVWPLMQMGVAWVFLQMPERWFRWRDGGQHRGELALYRRVLQVKRWKRFLPDGGAWMGGFSKRKLVSHQAVYLERFVAEARRGEAAHWVSMVVVVVFFVWNPREVWPVLVLVALMLNAPCIVVQRYNRFALVRHVMRDRA